MTCGTGRWVCIDHDRIEPRSSDMSSDIMVSMEQIERAIYLIRGQKVMLDRDLAALYEVETKRLKEQVR